MDLEMYFSLAVGLIVRVAGILLAVQWLRSMLLLPGSKGVIPGWGANIPYACVHAQSCPTLCDLMDCSSSVHGDSPGKNTGVGCHFFLQGILPTQGSNWHLLHWQAVSLFLQCLIYPITNLYFRYCVFHVLKLKKLLSLSSLYSNI